MFSLEKQFVYKVQFGDTINSICNNFNTSKNNIMRNNASIPLFAGECIEITVNNYITHIVKPAQTLAEIAKIYNLDVETIKQANKLETDKVFIGQMLKIYNEKSCV